MSILPFTKRVASGEVPVLTPSLASKLSGSVVGATERDVQVAAVEMNPMRLLTHLCCCSCGYHWQAPSIGACPSCHSEAVRNDGAIPCMAARI